MDMIAVAIKLRCIASCDRGNTIQHSKRARRNGHASAIIGNLLLPLLLRIDQELLQRTLSLFLLDSEKPNSGVQQDAGLDLETKPRVI